MAENIIEKITSEIVSFYDAANRYRPDNTIECRAKFRRALQAKLQSYVDNKSIASFTVVCDESNNTGNTKQPVKIDVFVRITSKSSQDIISLPLKPQANTAKNGSLLNELNEVVDGAASLWSRLTGKKK
ncbi:MAG: hypothetical protein Q8Q50_03295 [Methylobacter sp.]|nr:hypothetical protein [Methylobacter sp.]